MGDYFDFDFVVDFVFDIVMKTTPSTASASSPPGWWARNAWIWFLLAFICLIAATIWTIRIAAAHAPQTVPLETGQSNGL